MSDTTVADTGSAEGAAPAAKANIIAVPIVKAGKGETVDLNLDELPDDVYREIMFQGAKQVLNRNMTKIVAAAYTDAEAKKAGHADKAAHQKADALKIAAKNVEDAKAGKIRLTSGSKKAKASGAVMTEAMRIARALVKDAIKATKQRVSDYKASDITVAAKAYIEADPTIIEMAQKAVDARESKAVPKVDLATLIKKDPVKVAANDAKAKAKKGEKGTGAQLSAKQAGIPARQKPAAGAAAN